MNQRAQTVLAERYVLQAKLGEGGMGTVYRAHDTRLDAPVVVKMPHAALLSDKEFAERFSREARSLVQLRHPHVVAILDVGQYGRVPFVVMQYLGGGSLDDRIKSAAEQRLVWTSLKDWLPVIGDALDFIHRMSYVHRDVKPANILFDEHGNAFLSDFGIAKALSASEKSGPRHGLTGAGMVVGTAEYMAPEIILGESYDGRSDQYSLAIAVFEVLAGQRPFFAPTPSAVLVQQVSQVAPSLNQLNRNIPVWLADAVQRGLAKNPGERFGTCRDFCAAVFEQPPAGAQQRQQTPTLRASPSPPAPASPILAPEAPQALVETEKLVVTATTDPTPLSPRRGGLPYLVWLIAGAAGGALALVAILFLITSGKRPAVSKEAERNGSASKTIAIPNGNSSPIADVASSPSEKLQTNDLGQDEVFIDTRPPNPSSWMGFGFGERLQGDTTICNYVAQIIKAPPKRLKKLTLDIAPLKADSLGDARFRVLITGTSGSGLKIRPVLPVLFESETLIVPPQRQAVSVDLKRLQLKQGEFYAIIMDSFADRTGTPAVFEFGIRDDNPYAEGYMLQSLNSFSTGTRKPHFDNGWQIGALGSDFVMRLTVESSEPPKAASTVGTPPESVDKDARVYARITDSKTLLAASFDSAGRLVACGGASWRVQIHDAASGDLIVSLDGHDGPIWALAFHPSKDLLASASGDGTVKLWNVETRKNVATLTAGNLMVFAVAFSPDGESVASAGEDGVRLWSIKTGDRLLNIDERAQDVAFSSKGDALIIHGGSGEIGVRSTASGKRLLSFQAHKASNKGGGGCVATSRDGRLLATASHGDRRLKLWDLSNGDEVESWRFDDEISFHSVSFSPDGRFLVAGRDDGYVMLQEAKKGGTTNVLKTAYVGALAFSWDRSKMAVACGNTLFLWQLPTAFTNPTGK